MAKTKRPIAEVLMESGVDGSTAEDIARIVAEFDINGNPSLEDLQRMEGIFDPQAIIRDSRAAWWSNDAVPFEYKRLLDAQIENTEGTEPEALTTNLIEQWDANLGRFIAKGYLETPASLNTLERYFDHTSRIDQGPERPDFGTVNEVLKFYRANSNSHDSLPMLLVDTYLDACLKAAKRDISHVLRDERGRWTNTPGVGDDAPTEPSSRPLLTPDRVADMGVVDFRHFVYADENIRADVLPHVLAWSERNPGALRNPLDMHATDWSRLLNNHGINTLDRYAKFLSTHDADMLDRVTGYNTVGASVLGFKDLDFDTLESFLAEGEFPAYRLPREVFVKVMADRPIEDAYRLLTGPADQGRLEMARRIGGNYLESILDVAQEPDDLGLSAHVAIEMGVGSGKYDKKPHTKLEEGYFHFRNTSVDNLTGEEVAHYVDDAEAAKDAIQPEFYYSMEEKGAQKHAVVEGLMDKPTGLEWPEADMRFVQSLKTPEYKEVNEMIGTWAKTSNDHDMRALGLQETVSEHFGVPLHPWQVERIAETRAQMDSPEWHENISNPKGEKFRYLFQEEGTDHFDEEAVGKAKWSMSHYLDKMYAKTQAHFESRGITHVRLYRGTNTGDANPGVNPGDVVQIADNAMSSWSIDFGIARMFADRKAGQGFGKYGTMVSAVVPVERILSTAQSGFGCLTEGEAVVLASEGPSYVRVEYTPNLPSQDLWKVMQDKKEGSWDRAYGQSVESEEVDGIVASIDLEDDTKSASAKAERDISHVWRDESGQWTDTPGIGDDAPKKPKKRKGDESSSSSRGGQIAPGSGFDDKFYNDNVRNRDSIIALKPKERMEFRTHLLGIGATESDLQAFGFYEPFVDPPDLLNQSSFAVQKAVIEGELTFDQFSRWANHNDFELPRSRPFNAGLARIIKDTTPTYSFAGAYGALVGAGHDPGMGFFSAAVKTFPETASLRSLPAEGVARMIMNNFDSSDLAVLVANDARTDGVTGMKEAMVNFANEFGGDASLYIKEEGSIAFRLVNDGFSATLEEYTATTIMGSETYKPEWNEALRKVIASDTEVDGDFGVVMERLRASPFNMGLKNDVPHSRIVMRMLGGDDTPIKSIPPEWTFPYTLDASIGLDGEGKGREMFTAAARRADVYAMKKWAEEIRSPDSKLFVPPHQVRWAAERMGEYAKNADVLNGAFLTPDGKISVLGEALTAGAKEEVKILYAAAASSDNPLKLKDGLNVLAAYGGDDTGKRIIERLGESGQITLGGWQDVSDTMKDNGLHFTEVPLITRIVNITGIEGMTDEDQYKLVLSTTNHSWYQQGEANTDTYRKLLKGFAKEQQYILPDIETGEKTESNYHHQQAFFRANNIHRGEGKNAGVLMGDEAGMQKDAIATRISQNTGLSYDESSKFVRQWAHTSNGGDLRSLGIQQVAAETFDTDLSSWQKEEYSTAVSRGGSYPLEGVDGMDREQAKKKIAEVLSDMKADTEAYFEESHWRQPTKQSVDPADVPVLLYRGIIVPRGTVVGKYDLGETAAFEDNALSSWTISEGVAKDFAFRRNVAKQEGVVLAAYVPQSRILSTSRTGFGCVGEFEYVVIGSPDVQYAKVLKVFN